MKAPELNSRLWPALIIGLPDRYRGQALETQLSAQGIAWERFPGVLVADHLPKDVVDQAGARLLLRRELAVGEIGCALAHRAAYQKIVRERRMGAVIFEDDARLIGPIDELALIGLLDNSRPRVIMLSYKAETTALYRRQATLALTPMRTVVPPTTTTAYAVNFSAANLLLDDSRPLTHVADWPVRVSSTVEYFVFSVPVARPDPSEASTIGSSQRATASTFASTISRWAASISHVRWLRHRAHYGRYANYVIHEFLRMPLFAKARRHALNSPDKAAISGRFVDTVARAWR